MDLIVGIIPCSFTLIITPIVPIIVFAFHLYKHLLPHRPCCFVWLAQQRNRDALLLSEWHLCVAVSTISFVVHFLYYLAEYKSF